MIPELAALLSKLAQERPFRITYDDGCFAVELFSSEPIAKVNGVGTDGRFSVAYEKALQALKSKGEEGVNNERDNNRFVLGL